MSRRKHETIVLRVTLAVPVGANGQMVEEYVRTAVKSDCGGLAPDNPMFELDKESVRVKMIERHTEYVDTSNPTTNRTRGRAGS